MLTDKIEKHIKEKEKEGYFRARKRRDKNSKSFWAEDNELNRRKYKKVSAPYIIGNGEITVTPSGNIILDGEKIAEKC